MSADKSSWAGDMMKLSANIENMSADKTAVFGDKTGNVGWLAAVLAFTGRNLF